jgi:hypothetical protein
VVDTKNNKIIKQLLYWDKYADDKFSTLPANNTAFDVTIPTDLGAACATAGNCVSFPNSRKERDLKGRN